MKRNDARAVLRGHDPEFAVSHHGRPQIRCTCGEDNALWGFVEHILDVLDEAEQPANAELSPREQYLRILESFSPGPVLQKRIDEVRERDGGRQT